MAAIGISTASKAAWTAGVWPACEQGRASTFVEGGVTNPVQVAWARDCFAAIVERAQAVYNQTNELAALEALIDDLPGIHGVTTNLYHEHTNSVLVFQTEVLRQLKLLTKELAPHFVNGDIDPGDADVWFQTIVETTNTAVTFEVNDSCGDFDIEGSETDLLTWTVAQSLSNLLVSVRRPQNYFDVHPFRWQAGVCETNLTVDYLFWTNSQTAAGFEVPDDWPLAVWTLPDYGWDGLRDSLRKMKATSAGVGSVGQNVVWRPAGPDAKSYASLVNIPFQANCAGDYGTSNWVAAVAIAEANVFNNTPSPHASFAPYLNMVGASSCNCFEAGATVYQAVPVMTNRTSAAQIAGLSGEVFWYALREDANDFDVAFSLDAFGSEEIAPGDALVIFAPVPSQYADIPAWPGAPSNAFAILDGGSDPHRGVRKNVFWFDPFALIQWYFQYD